MEIEYQTLVVPASYAFKKGGQGLYGELAKYGQDGWDLVSAIPRIGGTLMASGGATEEICLVFKRTLH